MVPAIAALARPPACGDHLGVLQDDQAELRPDELGGALEHAHRALVASEGHGVVPAQGVIVVLMKFRIQNSRAPNSLLVMLPIVMTSLGSIQPT